MEPTEFDLPPEITDLLTARNNLRQRYHSAGLAFTLDGNLVGDIGEAIAAELFGVKLGAKCGVGIDGYAPDGRSVQVKSSGSNLGPAFRFIETRADHLLFFNFDFEACRGVVTFNGPESIAIAKLPVVWKNQRSITLAGIRRANEQVNDADRLPFLEG
ncbi:MAG: hypothetical protein KJ728_06000 [Alphaproteobacteria bacterium]|uniref:DUF6998 domain-containing protein n=1 Tax=Brevundimonas sp. TaxID=1871086 RepID=UPI001DDD0493|nr:hypothetical protein [Alphaproteobacteria bacterium]MBU1520959.1 hypothetical protein [Alphaproteobacteria bacterium]MBU2164706.1 hypothetical protein [Alphaproteobacteria bacterium]MBU2233048.1 hypothetical protein [Alphaproteobacteria bacterium]MBU2347292.1 hypothetical protein [Alphaproteobacteria bacterium]